MSSCQTQSLPFKKKEEVIERPKEPMLSECLSEKNIPIFHYDKISHSLNPLKILVFATTHGDEPSSTKIAYNWIERLKTIDSRSSWRIVPVLNPDGLKLKTRMNANKVDINRNFPTRDFETHALKYWKEKKKSAPRRFPGLKGGSERETKCAIAHIEDYKPDFVISIHAPYGILDFDGPGGSKPFFKHLAWRRLGHFPGSLGRYLWYDRKIPVLTIELKSATEVPSVEVMHELQDVSGSLAIRSVKSSK